MRPRYNLYVKNLWVAFNGTKILREKKSSKSNILRIIIIKNQFHEIKFN